jgi:hypothetical protein
MYSAMPAFAALSGMPKPRMPWWPQTADRERMYTCSQKLTGFKSDTALKSYRFANFLGKKSLRCETVKYCLYNTFKNK